MAKLIGEAVGIAGVKQALLAEALQNALDGSPAPKPGTDVQNFQLLAVEFEHGGFTGTTKTRVTLNVKDGPLKNKTRAKTRRPRKARAQAEV